MGMDNIADMALFVLYIDELFIFPHSVCIECYKQDQKSNIGDSILPWLQMENGLTLTGQGAESALTFFKRQFLQ